MNPSQKAGANEFKYSRDVYVVEFEDIISKIICCYKMMLRSGVGFPNNENIIRDELYLHYLNDNNIRKQLDLLPYFFDRETPEDHSQGRVDIRVITSDVFQDTAAYYIIECKRLNACNPNGISGLNAEYIRNGISRFTSAIYSTHYKVNGMIGFIVQAINIFENIDAINVLLKRKEFSTGNLIQHLAFHPLRDDFKYSFRSLHKTDSGDYITLYHLMLDLSENIAIDKV